MAASTVAAATEMGLAGSFGLTGALSAIPVAGWAAAGVAAIFTGLKSFTNLFGASYGKHNADAGFYFDRKSHSKSGKWGYDVGTLGNVFMAKVDAKIEEAKKKQKTEETTKS